MKSETRMALAFIQTVDDAVVVFNGGVFKGRSHGVSRLYRDRFPAGKTGRRMDPAPGFELPADQLRDSVPDNVKVSPDLRSAVAVFPYSIQVGMPFETETSLAAWPACTAKVCGRGGKGASTASTSGKTWRATGRSVGSNTTRCPVPTIARARAMRSRFPCRALLRAFQRINRVPTTWCRVHQGHCAKLPGRWRHRRTADRCPCNLMCSRIRFAPIKLDREVTQMPRFLRLVSPFVLVAIVGFMMVDRRVEGQGQGPAVTIAAPLPLPVIGTITGTANVNADFVREPVNFAAFCANNDGFNCPGPFYAVPPGKRLVIEYVALFATGIPAGDAAVMAIGTTVGTVSTSFQTTQSPLIVGGRSRHGQTVHLYADPSTNVVLNGTRLSGLSGGANSVYEMRFSGYLVPVD